MTFISVFRPKMNVYFRFVFGRKWNFIFVGIFVYGRKWKMLFGRLLVYITKRSWSWDAKSWSWSWSWNNFKVLVLVLVLNLRSWSGSWSWKKVLTTSLTVSEINSDFDQRTQVFPIVPYIYTPAVWHFAMTDGSKSLEQAVRVATQYASATCKLTISSYLFARWHLLHAVCWLFKTSATSWPLTFWPWKWCPSHKWRGLPLSQF